MRSITIRGIDQQLGQAIKKYSGEKDTSINQWILSILRKVTGLDKKNITDENHDLDKLAGTWDKKQASEFETNIKYFEQVDKELWK
jgi:hypothetical protein